MEDFRAVRIVFAGKYNEPLAEMVMHLPFSTLDTAANCDKSPWRMSATSFVVSRPEQSQEKLPRVLPSDRTKQRVENRSEVSSLPHRNSPSAWRDMFRVPS